MRQSKKPGLKTFLSFFFGYLAYFLGTFLFAFASFFFFIIPHSRRRETAARLFQRSCHFFTCKVLPGLGVYRIDEWPDFHSLPRPSIIIANHRSRIDAPLMLGAVVNAGTLMKESYARAFLLKSFVNTLDIVPVAENSRDSLARAMEKCTAFLKTGKHLVIFPEGTRARSGRLGDFRELAFRLSADTGIPVVSVVIHFDLPFLARVPGSIFPARPMVLRVRHLGTDSCKENQSGRDLSSHIHRQMAQCLKVLDTATPWERVG